MYNIIPKREEVNSTDNEYGYIKTGKTVNNTEINSLMPNKNQKKQLVFISLVLGFCVILYLLLSQIAGNLIYSTSIKEFYYGSFYGECLVDISYTVLCVFLPFFIGFLILRKIIPNSKNMLRFGKPKSASLFALAILSGLAALVLFDYITSYVLFVVSENGISYYTPENDVSYSAGTFVLDLVRSAFIPAFIEEFAIRGVIMQPLRRYGDFFAVLSSSFLFGLMHGNLSQGIFSFMLAMVIGYFVIITESIWTGVIIHFLNNSFSVILTTVRGYASDDVYRTIFAVSTLILFAVGIAAFVYLVSTKRKDMHINRPPCNDNRARNRYFSICALSFILTPTVLGAVIYMIVIIAKGIYSG